MENMMKMNANELEAISGGVQRGPAQDKLIERRKFRELWEPRVNDAKERGLTLRQFLRECQATGLTMERIRLIWKGQFNY